MPFVDVASYLSLVGAVELAELDQLQVDILQITKAQESTLEVACRVFNL